MLNNTETLQDIRVTIPKEVIEASQINLNKTIYLYITQNDVYNVPKGALCLSNKQSYYNPRCFGSVVLDENYSFMLYKNIVSCFRCEPPYSIFSIDKKIYIKSVKNNSRLSFNSIELNVPQALINISKVNFSKPMYLCKDNEKVFISNHHKGYRCYGSIKLDSEQHFSLNESILLDTGFNNPNSIYLYSNGNKIFIDNNNK